MNSYDLEIIKVLLEQEGLRHSEISDRVYNSLGAGFRPSKDALRVTIAVRLKSLIDAGVLRKRVIRYIRYYFTDEDAREKARRILLSNAELKKALLHMLRDKAEHVEGVLNILLFLPCLAPFELTKQLVIAMKENRYGDLMHIKNTILDASNAFCHTLVETLQSDKIRDILEKVDWKSIDENPWLLSKPYSTQIQKIKMSCENDTKLNIVYEWLKNK